MSDCPRDYSRIRTLPHSRGSEKKDCGFVESKRGADSRRIAFSMVEILVVVSILALLIGIVFKGGTALITRSKARDTEALMKTLTQAIDAYKSEVKQSRIQYAEAVFVGAPPDNPGVFQSVGTSITGCDIRMSQSGRLLEGGIGGTQVTDDLLDPRGSNGQLSSMNPSSLRHGDIRAMILAMRLRSPQAGEILDRIDPRFRKSGADEGLIYDPDSNTIGDEIPLDYFVDAWGNALEYFCTCPCDNRGGQNPREIAAISIFHGNNTYPVLVSYGPNGSEQLSKEFMDTFGDTTIVGDYWSQPDGTLTSDGLINHELNDDNIYSSEGLKERLRTGS